MWRERRRSRGVLTELLVAPHPWQSSVSNDMQLFGFNARDARDARDATDKAKWRRDIGRNRPTQNRLDNGLKTDMENCKVFEHIPCSTGFL